MAQGISGPAQNWPALLRGSYFLLARLLDDAAHGVGRLGAVLDPVIDAGEIDIRVVAGLLRVVVAHEFDELAITRAALVGDDHFIIRFIEVAFAAEADADGHGV